MRISTRIDTQNRYWQPRSMTDKTKRSCELTQLLDFLGWPEGIEPSYVRVTVVSVNRFTMATTTVCQKPAEAGFNKYGGAEQDRTVDLLTASQALSQLSYSPTQSNRT